MPGRTRKTTNMSVCHVCSSNFELGTSWIRNRYGSYWKEEVGQSFRSCITSPVVVVCPCRSNAEHRGLLSDVSMVMCVDVVSDQPNDRTSSTQSWCDCQSHLAGSQETWVRNGRWILLTSITSPVVLCVFYRSICFPHIWSTVQTLSYTDNYCSWQI
jgi:hypothetical protein